MRKVLTLAVLVFGFAGSAWASGSWLKGDFHVHSDHSSDAKDSSVSSIMRKAESLKMDFLVITDHDNHVEGRIETWDDPDYSSPFMTLLYGAEWTTGQGHANLIGSMPFDYAPFWNLRDVDIPRSLELAHAQNLHFSVNHPAAKDNWIPGFDLAVDSTEVWTAVFGLPDNNRKAIQLWDEVLLKGRRLAARGGSDAHHQKDFESQLFNIGNPTTWVFADDRSGASILAALRAGKVSISYAATAERIEFYADPDGNGQFSFDIGSNVPLSQETNMAFRIVIAGARPGASYDVDVIKNGKLWKTISTRTGRVEFTADLKALERNYFRVEVRGSTPDAPWLSSLAFGRFVGMTNPIYINY